MFDVARIFRWRRERKPAKLFNLLSFVGYELIGTSFTLGDRGTHKTKLLKWPPPSNFSSTINTSQIIEAFIFLVIISDFIPTHALLRLLLGYCGSCAVHSRADWISYAFANVSSFKDNQTEPTQNSLHFICHSNQKWKIMLCLFTFYPLRFPSIQLFISELPFSTSFTIVRRPVLYDYCDKL